MTFQISKDGDITTGEFSEVSYSGKGNGSDIYINTGKYADEITSISGTFKFGNEKTGTYDTTVWGAVNSAYTDYFWTRGQVDGLYVYIGSPSAPLWNLSAYMIVGNIYTLTATNNGSGSWTITLYNHTLGSQVYTNTATITGTIPHLPVYMMARNLNGSVNYSTMRTLYKFSIDGETWYVNKGTGTTLTGTNGTELTVEGTTTNFWNIQTDVWNYNGCMKAIKEPEYAGQGNGTNISIDTGVVSDDVTNVEIVFDYTKGDGVLRTYFGSIQDGSTRFALLKYTNNKLYLALGTNLYAINYSDLGLVTLGNTYKLILTLGSGTVNSKLYLRDPTNKMFTLVDDRDVIWTGVLGTYTTYLFNLHYAGNNYWIDEKIYLFKINNETYYINEGEGSTLTGDQGTVLNIGGTLTNFWQSDGGARYGKLTAPEFIEDYTYTGHGNGTDINITTAIRPIDITSMSMIFKYTNYEYLNAYFGSLTNASNRFVLYKYPSTNNLSFAGGNSAILFALSSYVTLGNIYKIDLEIDDRDIHIDFYEWNTSTEEFDLVYSDDATITEGTTFGTSPIRIFNRTYLSNNYWVEDNIYMVKINDETWYFNSGTGSSVTGSKGTVWNIDGTLTNFWQPSDIPNLDAQMKSYIDRTKVKREMIEV